MAEPTFGVRPGTPVEGVAPDALGSRVAECIEAGGRFAMLVGLDERSVGGDGLAVEAVVQAPGGAIARLRAGVSLDEPAYPSITRLVPAAHWDEREARDLLGIVPAGHPDPRRLVLHERWPRGYHPLRKDVPVSIRPPDAERHFVPFEVHGEGVYQLPVGPIHAGVIEPGHFRFSAIGERILHLDARLFFVHRGLEKLVEGRAFGAALPIVERACGVCTVSHALAFSEAVEELTGIEVPARARWARVLLAELERLYNHVGDLGNICAGIGFQSAVSRLGWLKERLLRINDALTGHRYLTGIVAPGGLAFDLDRDGLSALPRSLEAIGTELAAAVRSIVRSDGVMSRFHGTGVVSPATATSLGALGVAARACGLDTDLRRDAPYAAYGDLDVEVVTASGGDVAARFHVRAQEAGASIRLLREVIRRLPDGPVMAAPGEPPTPGAVSVTAVEGPRGASWMWLRAGAGGTVDRLRLRSASFANWPVVAAAAPGNLVPDFPLINKSFELCYACTDR
ncbi:MAG: NADH-quinone oxidoreductase subunit F [Chloroflexota bacterium]|nr:MAG: NADH-quinone oxidoreductase subunit F [Chloroflexota bacterium]